MPRLHPLAHLIYDTIAFSFMRAANGQNRATAMFFLGDLCATCHL